jgi:type II secretory pathway component PulK
VRRSERGAALLLVLGAVAILTVLAVELASRASADSLRATRGARDATFRRLFDSGAEVARGLLAEPDLAPVTHWGQTWNLETPITLEPGENVAVRMADESGKLNISRAISVPTESLWVRDAVRRFFDYQARQDRGRAQFWKDTAEKVLQRLLSREPLLTLDGLREVGLEFGQVFQPDGLSHYFTCFGDGTINLNTAPKAVLAALDPEFDDLIIERVARYRGKGEGKPGTYKAFEVPEDLMLVEGIVTRSIDLGGQIRVTRNLYEKVKGLVTARSSCFSARMDAVAFGREREAWVFLKPSGVRIAFEELQP